MSKCRESYEKIIGEPWGYDLTKTQVWQAAWNARGKVDAEVCKAQANDFNQLYSREADGAVCCKRAIEQAQMK